MYDEDTLAHFGVPGMKWGRRKTPQEQAEIDRKRSKFRNGAMGGVFGAMAAITLADLAAKNGPAPVKKKGLAYVVSLFKKKPPTVVLNPKNLNTANLAVRSLTSSRYGKAVIALGGFAVASSIGSKIAGSNFDKDQLDPNRIAAREANTVSVQSFVDMADEATRKKIQGP